MADSLGVPAACVADWERGVSYPGPVIILRICEKFSVTPNELYFDQTRSEQQLSEDERDLVMQYRELDVLDKQRIRDLTDHLRWVPWQQKNGSRRREVRQGRYDE